MRPIKFRGKRISTGEWSIGYLVSKDEINVNVFGGNSIIGHIVDPATVGQFTGLKDKNGVDIFEGDLVKTWGMTKAITVDNYHGIRFLFGEHLLCRVNSVDGEVIGNIHDTPGEEGE